MIRAFSKGLLALLVLCAPLCAQAAIQADPQALYNEMKAAYDKGAANNWAYRDELNYLSTIFNAGRAYSLQRPSDPAYGELATLAVQIGSSIHYNPLTNHDGAAWYVREAADWVSKNATDPDLAKAGADLLARINAEDAPERLALLAQSDAQENVRAYPGDVDAALQEVEADWRAWLLTHDWSWRTLALQRTAAANFPIAHLPTTYGPELINAAQEAEAGVAPGYSAGDKVNGATIVDRLKHLKSPLIIASVHAVPHDVYLSTLAPADEYFGRMGYSVLGIDNELKHVNFMLDYNYGNRESSQMLLIVDAVESMHRVYPRDRDMPKLLLSCIKALGRMDAPETKAAAVRLKTLLTIEYQDSPEARKVLNGES
jgi:hypothetical protein